MIAWSAALSSGPWLDSHTVEESGKDDYGRYETESRTDKALDQSLKKHIRIDLFPLATYHLLKFSEQPKQAPSLSLISNVGHFI